MIPERRRQVEELYLAVRDRTPDERAARLAASDPEVRREVEALLWQRGPASLSPYDETAADPVPTPGGGMSIRRGTELGVYRIEAPLGAGGMGEVYRATDRKLGRDVAIKMLPDGLRTDPDRLTRLRQEARMLAALNHPNIAAIYGLEECAGHSLIVLELVEGETLAAQIARRGASPPDEGLRIAAQAAAALEAAHDRGITHRDIKPANIAVTPQGTVKVLDFGLARGSWSAEPDHASLGLTSAGTQVGTLLGTPPYMSPEQVHGRRADHRSDVWAFGCVLYELLTGSRAFGAESVTATLAAILEHEPDWGALPARTPPGIRAVLRRCLEKDPDRRYPSGAELRQDVDRCLARHTAPGAGAILRRPAVAVPALLTLLAALAAGSWLAIDARRQRWARQVALPEIARLLETDHMDAAFRLGTQAERYIPDDRQLLDLRRHYTARPAVASTPPDADVYVKGYLNVDAEWLHIGRTPIDEARVPSGYLRWRIVKEGFEPLERAAYGISAQEFQLEPAAASQTGMVRVPGGRYAFPGFPPVTLEDYWLDRFEITNRQFRQFVDEGGYANHDYWQQPFVVDGRTLEWEEGIARLRDTTGRPGPATWAFSSYPDGQDDLPVSGVSWYEAAAYAAFAGARLPTVHHWLRAHATPQASEILRLSNFSGEGPAAAGRHAGLSPYGNYDMAGNVREWCWNASSEEAGSDRYVLGASWADPAYRFPGPEVATPWDRSPRTGFRTARYGPPDDATLEAPVARAERDVSRLTPVSDEVFETYRRFYSYERTDLAPAIETVDDGALHWRRETITFNAAYGGERVIAHLFLPRNAEPPYQPIVYFASGVARQSRSSEQMDTELRFVDFLPRVGRAVLFLVYKGTYERHIGRPAVVPTWTRDMVIAFSRDFSRSIDYLQTRPDMDHVQIGYFSFSNPIVPVLSALDGRIRAGAHIGAGLIPFELAPEFDPVNFAPRATEPTLLIGGRYDFIGPVETSQLPLLRLLGAPDDQKRLALFETGHVVYPGPEMIKEVIDWFDRYLGPVQLKTERVEH